MNSPTSKEFPHVDPGSLAQDSKVVSADRSGISPWTKIAKLSVILFDGSEKRCFLKVRPIR
jgi:hypothetical protein